MNRRPILHLLLTYTVAVVLLPGSVLAEFDFESKYAGDYLTGQSTARLLALGGSGVAIAHGTEAVLANPARISVAFDHAASFMHADRFESAVKVDHASYVRRLADGRHVGFGLVRQGVDDIPVTRLRDSSQDLDLDNRVVRVGSTSASEYAFLLSYALDEVEYGRFGASAKLLYKRLDETNGYGLGIDLGYTHRIHDIIVGAQLRDAIVSVLTWDTGRQEVIYPTLRVGAAYEFRVDRLHTTFIPLAELQLRGESLGDSDMLAVHAGLEAIVRDLVALRIGYDGSRHSSYDGDDRPDLDYTVGDYLTYGAGLRIGAVAVDYAFLGNEDLGATHRISIGVNWGG